MGAPCAYVSLHRRRDASHDDVLLLIEDVTEISDVDVQNLRQRDFLERLLDSMQEIVLTVDRTGHISWASRRCAGLRGKNLFATSRPSATFTDTWDAAYLSGSSPAAPVEAVLELGDGSMGLFELVFSALDAREHEGPAFLVVGRDLTSIRRLEEKVKQQAMYDGLTGLFNHSQFHMILEREMERSRRTNRQLGLIFFDLDRFKAINDTYGHQAGDTVLRRVAAGISAVVRKGMDFPCRYGGDEFAVVVTEVTPEIMEGLARRIREGVVTSCKGAVDLSMGLALLAPPDTGESLVQRADRASYAAKKLDGVKVRWAE
ncbi:Diguanylate cyclase, GGDEF domain [anaerobic digester metagenome]